MTIKNFIEKNRTIFIQTGFNLFILSIIFLILDKASILNIHNFINPEYFFALGAVLAAPSYILANGKSFLKIKKDLIKYLFLFLLLLITIGSLKFEIINSFVRFLLPFQPYLFVLTAAAGFLFFWLNKHIIFYEIKRDKIKEVQKEEKQKRAFVTSCPRVNSIPILRNLARWAYNEGVIYAFLLFIIFLAGVALRIWNLGYLSPFRDEYTHLLAAQGIWEYKRAQVTTYLVSFVFNLFDTTSLFIARLVPLIFGSLTTIIIYFLGRKINKKIGIIAALLWAVSPFSIGMSRYIREYSMNCFIMALFVLCFIYFFNSMKLSKFKIGSFLSLKSGVKMILLFIPIIGTFRQAWFGETYKPIILLALVCFFLYFASAIKIKEFFRDKSHRKKISLIVILLSLFFIFTLSNIVNFSRLGNNIQEYDFDFKENYINLYFDSKLDYQWSAAQWFLDSGFSEFLLIPLFMLPLLFYYKDRNFLVYFSCFWVLVLSLTVYIPLINPDRVLIPRFVYYAMPFYAIVYSAAIFIIYKSMKLFKHSRWFFVYYKRTALFGTSLWTTKKAPKYGAI